MTATTSSAPAESTTDVDDTHATIDETWRDRAKHAAYNQARNAAIRARTETRSLIWRNRYQLAPLAVTGAAGTIGTLGAAAAENSETITALAAAPPTGAIALATGWWAWRRYASQIPTQFLGRAKAALAAGCAWCATLPLTGQDNLGMWLTLGLGTVGLSARWWQHHRPGIPAPSPQMEEASTDGAAAEAQEPGSQERPDACLLDDQQMLDLWNLNVGGTDGPLAGATMSIPHRTLTNGRAYRVQLNPKHHTLSTARAALPRIAGGLRTTYTRLQFEATDLDDDSVVELRVIDRSPLTADALTYTGPRVVRDDAGGVHIELGPFADGEGTAQYTVFEDDSMRSGLIVGGTGSGKSRLVELIAIALRALGVEIWFLDPQEGQSSPALADHADWYLPGIGDDERPHGNIEDLFRALYRARSHRGKKLSRQHSRGFTHSTELPGIMLIIDEASDVFNAQVSPGITWGHRFGGEAKKIRKAGIGMLAVGHIMRLETFGGSKELRSSLMNFNTIALRTAEPSEKNCLPAGMPDPSTLPPIPGYGYISSSGSSRVAPYRSPDVPDVDAWLAARPAQGIDTGTANAIGSLYVQRKEIAAEKQRQLDRELAALENGDITVDDLDADDDADAPASFSSTTASSGMTLPSITGGEIRRAPGTPEGVPAQALKPRQQELLDLLAEHGELSTTEIADHLTISDRAVRKIITGLGETHLVKTGHRYRPR